MNEGYRLTDFTLDELSLMKDALQFYIAFAKDSDHDSLREMKVRALTAFSIVHEREKIVNS